MDNIRRGRLDAKDEEVIEACRKVELHEKIMSLPHGYETVINENLNFSGGESQKLGIARALLRKPSLIILDEPTSSLDPHSEKTIKNIIGKIKNHCTVLVIAHRLTTILNADRIFILEDGKIADEGSHDSLIQRNNLYFNFVSGSFIKQSL
ncbi:MAG TPA: ATP-binding cassette domain-containing protein [Pseudobacteroides sp.]|uniref:ATP-binding cassette domain-containing protein n=1 Tax=Pseudobacteroides sp. TaxID=1968840 RepID=UPI002F923FAE